jgi:hypothetical protein
VNAQIIEQTHQLKMKLLELKYGKEFIVAMGDTIDCVPLVNQVAEKHGKILLPVQMHCYHTIRSFFDEDKVQLHALRSFQDYVFLRKQYETISVIGIHDNTINWELDMVTVYKAAGLDYSSRDKYDTLKESAKKVTQKVVPDKPYAFVPEGGSTRTFKIDRKYISPGLEIIQPEHNDFMLAYANIIREATEIHCHATGWQRLIERLNTKGKLFMHHYARASVPPHLFPHSKEWVCLL